MYFCSFWEIELKNFAFCEKFFVRFVETEFDLSIRPVWGIYFWRKLSFLSFLEFEIKICGTPWKTFQAGLSKQHCTCQWNFFEEINVFFKHTKFSSTSSFLEQKFSAFSRSFSGRIVKTAYYVSLGTFWRKTFSCESFFFQQFHTLREEFSAFRPPAKIFLAGVSKLHFLCPMDQFEGFASEKNGAFCIIFGQSTKKHWRTMTKSFRRHQKKPFYVSIGNKLRKNFFLEKVYFFLSFSIIEKKTCGPS